MNIEELFNDSLDSKLDFLNEQNVTTSKSKNHIYKIDFSKVKDKKKGWKSVIRFLPNLTRDGNVGQSAIGKIIHRVDIRGHKELSGWFDSPKNFNEPCPLTELYYKLINSKNAILVERAKMLKYYKRYYSYVLVLEDEQQPELVGKIMVFEYGKIIKDKILAEKNGDITGESCNVFKLDSGKNFVLIAKEKQTGDIVQPDYSLSMFEPKKTSLPIYIKEKREFKNVPLNEEGKIDPKYYDKIKEFLLSRECDIEDFAPKRLTEEERNKINNIVVYMTTGKLPDNSLYNDDFNNPSSDDFDFETESNPTMRSSVLEIEENEDDFFKDF